MNIQSLHGTEEFSISSSALGSGKVIPEVVARTVSSTNEQFNHVRHSKVFSAAQYLQRAVHPRQRSSK
jgi:hypothetical protein